ncbi:hypothetical protein RAS1_08670 [Phycisphaerae bacterium RAS1]|nr:hypothetical protein RAS1_08670 [Phycisphaerae bacterium RAS1]
MGDFANTIRRQAAETMRNVLHREVSQRTDPLLELIAALLEDGAGGIHITPEAPVTTDQWLTWNRLVTERESLLVRSMTRVLERERLPLPMGTDAMRTWAARLLLITLDCLGLA